MVFMNFVVFGIYQVFILDTKKPLPLVVKPLATSLNHVIYNIKKIRFLCSITASESYNRNS
jgi:hypothetical protein